MKKESYLVKFLFFMFLIFFKIKTFILKRLYLSDEGGVPLKVKKYSFSDKIGKFFKPLFAFKIGIIIYKPAMLRRLDAMGIKRNTKKNIMYRFYTMVKKIKLKVRRKGNIENG